MDDISIATLVIGLLAVGLLGMSFLAGYTLGFNKRGWIESQRRHLEKIIEYYYEYKEFPENTPEVDKRKAMKIMSHSKTGTAKDAEKK